MGFLSEELGGGNAMAAMCSYAGVNGVPSCANNFLLNELVRKKWGRDDVMIVSDCGAINNMLTDDVKYASNESDAAAKAMNGGCDVDLGDNLYPPRENGGSGALYNATTKYGLVREETIDVAVSRVLEKRFLTGQFDPLEDQPFTRIGTEVIGSKKHELLSFDAALQGSVLLKNSLNTLPLKQGKFLAVLGPHINSTRDLFSDYASAPCAGGSFECISKISDIFVKYNGINNTFAEMGVELNRYVCLFF